MIILLLAIHIMVAIALVGVVLLQKSEGGALGMGGGGMSGFMTGRSTANLLTRTTAILAVLFMVTSLSLVWFSHRRHAPQSIIEQGVSSAPPNRQGGLRTLPRRWLAEQTIRYWRPGGARGSGRAAAGSGHLRHFLR